MTGKLTRFTVAPRQLMMAVMMAVIAGSAGWGFSGVVSGGAADALTRGKRIYFTRCAQCHRAIPIKQYSLKQWERLLPPMVKKSKLDATQGAELRAYVRATLLLPL